MAYGALLSDANGVPFYIADTMPLSLLEKRVLSVPAAGGNGASQDLFPNDGALRFVFANSTGQQVTSATCEALVLNQHTNLWQLWCVGAARTVNVFIFGYQFQPIPQWGIQINDAQGRCILTNETKVLRNVNNLGDSTNANDSGNRLIRTLPGQWAVAPVYTGYFAAVHDMRPVIAQFCSSARYDGVTTMICSGYQGNVDGSAGNATWHNYRNRITAIDVSMY